MVIVEFASGYEHMISDDRCLDVFHSEPDDGWWGEITDAVNPYDSHDEPIAVSSPGLGRIALDADGGWMDEFEAWPIWTSDQPENG